MSTIWTPGGEQPVGAGSGPGAGPGAEPPKVTEADLEAKMAELRRQLAEAPAEVVIANHCFGLFELAALHLSLEPPKLPEAQLAIDALGAVIEGLAGRLGDEEQQLRDGLSQLRIAFVQIKAAAATAPESSP
ncbi:MAG: DUF1844 domain-containing protein [Actinomycetota bacterium]|nr:DUF1844 domain-containing protein [Actinomycetota bacterium]